MADDVEQIFGKRPWTSRSEELMAEEEQKKNADQQKEKADEE
jgi:cell division protease FtsH